MHVEWLERKAVTSFMMTLNRAVWRCHLIRELTVLSSLVPRPRPPDPALQREKEGLVNIELLARPNR